MVDSTPAVPGELLLGKYRVERVLGKGGMGVVVAATHIALGELFAIKFLLPEAVEDPLAVERFLREARAAARLRGEHVTKVVDVGKLPNGAPYMVMEHLHGEDLRRLSKEQGPLPVAVAIDYVLQACEALAEAHAAGIVHRDIKPSNLFLTRRPNGTPCLKVLDFGISKQISGEDAELTRTGDLVGSPLYMSPEQLARSRGVDARADIWSLGMVFYKLLTGKVPFFGDSLPEIIARVMHEDTLPPSSTRPELPPALDVIVGRCLMKRPDERYSSVTELSADLRAVLQGEGIAAERAPVSRPVQSSRPSFSGPRSTPLPGAFASPMDAVTRADAAPRPRSEAPTGSAWGRTGDGRGATSSSRAFKIGGAVAGLLMVAGLSVFLTLRFAAQQAPAETPAVAAPAAPSSDGAGAAALLAASSRSESEPAPTVTAAASAAASSATPASASASVSAPASASASASGAAPASAPAKAPAAKPGASGKASAPAAPGKRHEGIY